MVGGREVLLLVLIHLLAFKGVDADDAEGKVHPKPFGLGVGPVFIGGRDTDKEGTQVALRILGQYINYKVLSGEATEQDALDYKNYYAENLCIGTCPEHSRCEKGVCVCNHDQGYLQVYGQCKTNSSGAYFAGDDAKYRKPTPPPIPSFCYCEERVRDREGRMKTRRAICPDLVGDERCKKIVYPNVFDDQRQYCDGKNNFCLQKDMNMFCSDKTMFDPAPAFNTQRTVCGCRKEMKFDRHRMECRIHIGADCSRVVKTGFTNPNQLTEVLNGQAAAPAGVTYDKQDVLQGFCLLLDGQADDYNAHLVGDFVWSIWGIGAGAFFAICCGSICAACCCCKCCESTKAKIRAMDPRNHIRNMDRNTQMAALGAVAANEYMDSRNDKNDAARMQAMQGGAPAGAPGYPAPAPGQRAGFPMPEGNGAGGYTPVPTGYGPAQQGYGQQPVYPQIGQPGYVAPEDKGMLGELGSGAMNMAPELALAGAGAYTGNNSMMGLGVLAAADKFDHMDDNEDRIRAAAMRNVPPPPMGYAGGAPLPTGAPPQMMNQPPPTANYPRQQMQ